MVFPLPFTKITHIPLGPITIQAWGLMVAIGVLAGLWVARLEAKRRKVSYDLVFDALFGMVVSGVVGSRLIYVLLFWRNFTEAPWRAFYIWEGGMVFLGGFLVAVAFLVWFVRRHKLGFWRMADLFAPSLALGLFFGRIGCFLIGDHIGSPMGCSCAWGSVLNGETQRRHEPSLYLMISNLLLFVLLWNLRTRLKKPGQLAMVFFIWYGVMRFILDFFRASDLPLGLSDPRFWGWTSSQLVSVVLFFAGWIGLWWFSRSKVK